MLINKQNPLSVTKVICRHSLTNLTDLPLKKESQYFIEEEESNNSDSSAVRSLPKSIWKKPVRRIWKTLFGTVAMNQVKLVSVIHFYFPLSYFFHGHNDSGLASLLGARYFQRSRVWWLSNRAKRGAA